MRVLCPCWWFWPYMPREVWLGEPWAGGLLKSGVGWAAAKWVRRELIKSPLAIWSSEMPFGTSGFEKVCGRWRWR